MTIFMKLTGIQGGVTAKNHRGWLELLSVELGIERQLNHRVGKMSDREKTLPTFQDLSITKSTDLSSILLFNCVSVGKVIDEAMIEYCHAAENLSAYAKYHLSNVMISEYKESTLSYGRPLERLKLNFTQIQKTYIPHDSQHRAQSPQTTGFNLTTATTL